MKNNNKTVAICEQHIEKRKKLGYKLRNDCALIDFSMW